MSRFFAAGSSDSDSSSASDDDYSDSDLASRQSGSNSNSDDSDSDSDSASDASDSDDSDAPAKKGNRFMVGGDSDDSDDDSDDGKKVVKSAKDKRIEEVESCVHLIENAQKINDWVTISSEFDKLNKLAEKAKAAQQLPKIYIATITRLEDVANEAVKAAKTKKMNPANTRALNGLKQRIKKNNRLYEAEIERYKADPDALDEPEPAPEPQQPKVKKDKFAVTPTAAVAGNDDGFATVGKGGKVLEYSAESIFTHLQAVFEARGKKSTNRDEQLFVLAKLKEVAVTPYQKIRVLLATVAARFDFSSGLSQYMPTEAWKRAQAELLELLKLLEQERSYTVLEDAVEHDDEQPAPVPTDEQPIVKIKGSIISYVDRLDDELTRALQNIDPHSQDYVDRLRDEALLYATIVRAQIYVEWNGEKDISRLIMRRMEHLYYKQQVLVTAFEDQAYADLSKDLASKITPREENFPLIQKLANYLYKNGTGLLRTRAMLCHIYNLALEDRYYEARDMLLMSHLQDSIHAADIQTQILHNRTMVQLGLSAFRSGLVVEAQQALSEICGGNRVKELLAQGPSKNVRDPEQERQDKARQLPFHLHLNLELSEFVYLTCSMLMEVPEMARGSKRIISRQFRRTLDFADRQIFSGPPENTRDFIMQASKRLSAGDWHGAYDLLSQIKIIDLMPQPDSIRAMLKQKVKEEGLRTYLFSYAPFYESVKLAQLASLFDLSAEETRMTVSRLIAQDELTATLAADDESLTFFRQDQTRLQVQAVQLAEKAQRLVEQNEQALDIKQPKGEGQHEGGRQTGGGGGEHRRRQQGGGGGFQGDRKGARGGRRQDFGSRLAQKIRA
ncbi:eukaryotic translation initiation factor 3 subunit 8 N-terminus-domain-containing protein [Protomyces lactucae-debilis]|uniref:Eukaryotic translation initiation factor 3 subunit C n=1 Tax=Protomyces lactucae-debilis TaxID=2754530 RepID=A0A1Y2F7H4_PROLT|nr:eukaryotic translation initiation factor 3 subunit 8 N-terminus-domain-containing protein [Protomyces lactucae-debilis]ORY79880.1 eukaryotic translation initiation factor 3 subunit 8 N-terminus-domain-containing protein [Protomyces lactucae-debilis]